MQSNNYPSPDFLYKYSYISDIREWDIIQGWKNIRMGDRVMDSDGNAILIIDPGSLNTYDGPDFKQAILYMNGQIHHGDIECHKTPSGWYHHGHENDPNYQNVILHVVGPFRRKNRQPNIPHVVLTIPAYSKIQCTISKQPNTILEILLPLATYRWQKKLAQYDRDMSEGRMVETSCGIFGTKGNEQGFLQIWNVLKDECHKDTSTDLLQKKIDTMYQSMEVRWSRAGIRPNARHKKRIPLFVSFIYLVSRMSYHGWQKDQVMEFMNKNFPAGLRTELLGNCILPYFGKSQGMSAYHHHLDDWMTLKLPYVYGRIGKQFSRYIPNDLLSLFWVQQGLIEYQNRYCKPALCDACSLR